MMRQPAGSRDSARDRPAVQFDDRSRDRQPEPSPARFGRARASDAVEAVEDALDVAGGTPVPSSLTSNRTPPAEGAPRTVTSAPAGL